MAPVKKPKPILQPHYLRAWRDFRDVSQETAAVAIGVERGSLSKIESGQVPYKQHYVEGLAALYRCTVGDLLSVDPTAPRPPITTEPEILSFLSRIEGLTERDISIAFGVIQNALAARQAGSAPSVSRDQQPSSTRPREEEPSRPRSQRSSA